MIDVGANIGWYSLVASLDVGAGGHVVAFEPEAANFALLSRNLERNGATNVVPRQVALGSETGTAPLFLSDDNRGDHRLFEGDAPRRATSIPVTTLDDVIADLPCVPTVVKCDTQGSEWAVVQGLRNARFDAVACCWIIEFWPHGLTGMGADPGRLLQWFDRYGYLMFEVSEGNPKLVATDSGRLMGRVQGDLSASSQLFINLLLIHPRDPRLGRLHGMLA